jgi:hypothetical protein
VANLTAGESAVYARDDGQPAQLIFLRRLSAEVVEVLLFIGGLGVGVVLKPALWDLGVREMRSRLDGGSPATFLARLHARGW